VAAIRLGRTAGYCVITRFATPPAEFADGSVKVSASRPGWGERWWLSPPMPPRHSSSFHRGPRKDRVRASWGDDWWAVHSPHWCSPRPQRSAVWSCCPWRHQDLSRLTRPGFRTTGAASGPGDLPRGPA